LTRFFAEQASRQIPGKAMTLITSMRQRHRLRVAKFYLAPKPRRPRPKAETAELQPPEFRLRLPLMSEGEVLVSSSLPSSLQHLIPLTIAPGGLIQIVANSVEHRGGEDRRIKREWAT